MNEYQLSVHELMSLDECNDLCVPAERDRLYRHRWHIGAPQRASQDSVQCTLNVPASVVPS